MIARRSFLTGSAAVAASAPFVALAAPAPCFGAELARKMRRYMWIKLPGGYTILADGESTVIGGPISELWAPLTEEARAKINSAAIA